LKITKILEKSVSLNSNVSNSLINFSTHTVSLIALVTDQVRNGRPVIGLSFNSIGRYAQSGIIEKRMVPRLLAAKPDSLLQDNGQLSADKVLACAMQNEKPGGHGDRAHAASGLELAVWDLNAKLNDEPASVLFARHFGNKNYSPKVSVYAAGGYYYPGEQAGRLEKELSAYQNLGFNRFKMKIGGAEIHEDQRRIEAVLSEIGSSAQLAVDANGRFDLETAIAYAKMLREYPLFWYEEAGDPLDYALQAALADNYPGAMATGENLFSHQDARNLLRYGGMRPDRDWLQFDCALSYGLCEYERTLRALANAGWSASRCIPHGGHQMSLNLAAGLGLGGNESYPDLFQPYGGFPDGVAVQESFITMPDLPGIGFEGKSDLIQVMRTLAS
jgi:L-alanine-DL-glutamate epimerase-like enolase superfamily enzyme